MFTDEGIRGLSPAEMRIEREVLRVVGEAEDLRRGRCRTAEDRRVRDLVRGAYLDMLGPEPAQVELIVREMRRLWRSEGVDAFGIRRLHADEPGDPGARLRPSFHWEDGEWTGEQLPGTSAARIPGREIQREAVRHALAWIAGYRFEGGDRLALIYGDSVAGDDRMEGGACLITNARVALAWPDGGGR